MVNVASSMSAKHVLDGVEGSSEFFSSVHEYIDVKKLHKQIAILKKSNQQLRSQKTSKVSTLEEQLQRKEEAMQILEEKLIEKEKEVRLFQIKMKEFQKGEGSLTMNEKQFLEVEALTSNNVRESSNFYQKLNKVGQRYNARAERLT